MAARLQFEITEEQRLRVSKVFAEHGMIRAIMSPILDEVLDLVEEHGYAVFGAILDSKSNVRKIIPSLRKIGD